MAFTDTSGDDSFSNETGALAATDSDSGDTLTYSISGQSADSSQTGYTHARTGTFGTLYINSTSGVYRYIPNDSALEGATTSQTDSFTLSVSDGTASASQTLTATVGGVNDTPVLASLSGVSFTDTANDDSFTAATATAGGSDRDTLRWTIPSPASRPTARRQGIRIPSAPTVRSTSTARPAPTPMCRMTARSKGLKISRAKISR